MKQIFVVLFSVLYTFSFAQSFKGKVTHVKDGDSFEIRIGKQTKEIRINGIDCPEYDQPDGDAATSFTYNLCYRKKVKVEVTGIDRYGRTLANITVGKKDLATELLKAGHAWHYKKYNSDSLLSSLEAYAKESHIGLWNDPSPTSPWDYRHGIIPSNTGPASFSSDVSTTAVNLIDDNVYICESRSSYAYHSHYCHNLKQCKSNVAKISKAKAIEKGRKACGTCYR